MRKYSYLFCFLIIGIIVGSRVFNHIDAWCGVFVIIVVIVISIYKLIQYLKNEKFD